MYITILHVLLPVNMTVNTQSIHLRDNNGGDNNDRP